MEYANQMLNEFKSHQDAWTVVDFILLQSEDINTRFFGLSILDEAVNVSIVRLLLHKFS